MRPAIWIFIIICYVISKKRLKTSYFHYFIFFCVSLGFFSFWCCRSYNGEINKDKNETFFFAKDEQNFKKNRLFLFLALYLPESRLERKNNDESCMHQNRFHRIIIINESMSKISSTNVKQAKSLNWVSNFPNIQLTVHDFYFHSFSFSLQYE